MHLFQIDAYGIWSCWDMFLLIRNSVKLPGKILRWFPAASARLDFLAQSIWLLRIVWEGLSKPPHRNPSIHTRSFKFTQPFQYLLSCTKKHIISLHTSCIPKLGMCFYSKLPPPLATSLYPRVGGTTKIMITATDDRSKSNFHELFLTHHQLQS